MVTLSADPVHLAAALASFPDTWSPRIVAQVNDYDVRVAHADGEHVWHVHEDTDEFFLVLGGEFTIDLRGTDGHGGDGTDGGNQGDGDGAGDGAERSVDLRAGDVFVVPAGTWHRPSASGADILMLEPSGTLTTGDRTRGAVPAHVDSTTGHELR